MYVRVACVCVSRCPGASQYCTRSLKFSLSGTLFSRSRSTLSLSHSSGEVSRLSTLSSTHQPSHGVRAEQCRRPPPPLLHLTRCSKRHFKQLVKLWLHSVSQSSMKSSQSGIGIAGSKPSLTLLPPDPSSRLSLTSRATLRQSPPSLLHSLLTMTFLSSRWRARRCSSAGNWL